MTCPVARARVPGRCGGQRGSVTVLVAGVLFAALPLLLLALGLGAVGAARAAAAADASAAAAAGSCLRAGEAVAASGAGLLGCHILPAAGAVTVTVTVVVPLPGWLGRFGAREVRATARRLDPMPPSPPAAGARRP